MQWVVDKALTVSVLTIHQWYIVSPYTRPLVLHGLLVLTLKRQFVVHGCEHLFSMNVIKNCNDLSQEQRVHIHYLCQKRGLVDKSPHTSHILHQMASTWTASEDKVTHTS